MSLWSPELREYFAPSEKLTGSEWGEKYRVLPRKGTAEPGRYNLDRTPYLREILDVLTDDQHQEVVFAKSAQVGGSEVGKTALGCWVDAGSDNVLLVLPDQKSAEEHLKDRMVPMLRDTPQLNRYVSKRGYDLRRSQVDLLHMTIYLGWSGSPQSLASRAIRCAMFDETDKSQDSSREAAAIDLIRDRLITYGNRAKLFILSTPTVTSGPIWQSFSSVADKRKFHVPCPTCGGEQELRFDQVRWENRHEEDANEMLRMADLMLAGQLNAWYECEHCGAEIQERQRPGIVREGRWVSSLEEEIAAKSVRVAYHISALYSPWVTLHRLVVEYLRGKANRDLRNFYNSFLGIPHEEYANKPDMTVLERRALENRAFTVPEWATVLTAGADTQASKGVPYWYYVVRAWGPNQKSRLITWGKAHSPEELARLTINAKFPVEGWPGRSMTPLVVCVDSGGGVELADEDGSTTDLVYRMARQDPARIIPVKGAGGKSRPDRIIKSSNVDYQPPGMPPTQVLLHTLDTERLKDIIASLIRSEDPVLWEESSAADKEYLGHMTAQEKTRVQIGKRFELKWTNTTRRRHDIWDATVYCLAAAKIVRSDDRREEKQRAEQDRDQVKQPVPTPAPTTRNNFTPVRRSPGSWIRKRR